MSTCEYCNKKIAHTYRNHDVCLYHYLKLNPQRNATQVLLEIRTDPPWLIKDRIKLIEEIKKAVSDEKIEEYLGNQPWYQRLKRDYY